MDVLVTYDIDTTTQAGERRLVRVARICEGFGVRAQYSVFECRLSTVGLARLVVQLEDEIDRATDSINLYRFAGTIPEARISLGRAKSHELGQPWIL
jgi:CRISPR-associated protein Cas2